MHARQVLYWTIFKLVFLWPAGCSLILLFYLWFHTFHILIQSHRIKPSTKSIKETCPCYLQSIRWKDIWLLSAFKFYSFFSFLKDIKFLILWTPMETHLPLGLGWKWLSRNWLRCIAGVWQTPDPCLLSLIPRDLRLSGIWRQNSDRVVLQPVPFGCVYSQPSCTRQQLWHLGNNSSFSSQYMRLCGAIKRMLQKKHWDRLPAPLLCSSVTSPKNRISEHNCPWWENNRCFTHFPKWGKVLGKNKCLDSLNPSNPMSEVFSVLH